MINKTKISITLILCILLVGVVLPFAKPASQKILCLGDSITFGLGIETSYPETLQSLSGISTVNGGVTGDWTSQMLQRWNNVYRNQGFTMLVLLGGINDIAHDIPIGTIENNLRSIWQDALNQGCTVYAVTILPCDYSQNVVTVDNWIWATAPSLGVHVVDVYSTFENPAVPYCMNPAYSYDGCHLNQAGVDLLASLVFDAFGSVEPTPSPTSTPEPTLNPTPTPNKRFTLPTFNRSYWFMWLGFFGAAAVTVYTKKKMSLCVDKKKVGN